MTSRVQHSANCWTVTKPISRRTVTHIRRSPRPISTRCARDLSRSTGILAVVSQAAAGNPSRCPKPLPLTLAETSQRLQLPIVWNQCFAWFKPFLYDCGLERRIVAKVGVVCDD